MWSDYDAETKDMYDTRKVGVDKVAIGKTVQWFLF
jgi:hypothetical protein